MKKSLIILTALVALVATVLIGSASAATISYVSINGTWHDPLDNVPGSQPGEPFITNGTPTSSISWGVTSGSQSGYDFIGTIPPPMMLPGPSPLFPLGTFTHRNFAVSPPSLTSVQLDVVLVLDVDGVQTAPLSFTFTFNHEETPNNATPCPYPTPPGEGCTDRVTFVSAPQPTTFNVGGVDYTLAMSFLDVNGVPVAEFITREGGIVNTSGLSGQFILPPIPPAGPALIKATTQPSATIGEAFRYRITVPAAPYAEPLYDVRILDDLTASAAGMEYVSVTKVSGPGAWTPTNTGTNTNLILEGIGGGIDIPPGEQVELDVTVRLQDTAANVAGLAFTNTASSTYNQTDNDGASQRPGSAHLSGPMTIVEPTLTLQKSGPAQMQRGVPGTFSLNVHNTGLARAFAPTIIDYLPSTATGGMCSAAPTQVTARVFQADGVTPLTPVLTAGTDYTVAFAAAPACTLTLNMLTPAASVGPDQRLIVAYTTLLDANPQTGAGLKNVAGVTDWYGLDPSTPDDQERHYTRAVTDGTPGVLDHQDAFTSTVAGPRFDFKKTSADLDGDPAVLLAGDRLRYTITVKNVGTEDATGVRLRDALPTYTTYIADSTQLNGTVVADGAGGVLPLENGIYLYAPENTTPGEMRADASATTANVATITFEVRIDPTVANATVVSNQGFVSAVTGGVADQPSDDPDTAVLNDPTRDVVGNYPLLYAEKSAVLSVDNGSLGFVDPGDYLRYTIKVTNNGNIPSTLTRLIDAVPNDVTYKADSMTLNGLPVGQPDNGVFPMTTGIGISSSDLTPPVPDVTGGTLSPHEYATVQFDVRVNDATPRGTAIINQATVTAADINPVLTDGDGNPATGPEPTVVVVGDAQALTITKKVTVVGGGPAVAGATLEYLVTVRNVATVPAMDVYVTDDLDETLPGQLLYVDQSALLGGTTQGVSVAGTVITANYSLGHGPLNPGQQFQLRFRAQLDQNLAIGTKVTNVAHVTWNTDQTAYAQAAIDVGGMVGSGILNGAVWHDADFDNVLDATERALEGWTVELRRNDQVIVTTTTDANGVYRLAGLVPNYQTANRYDLTFRGPGAGANTALLGLAYSSFRNDLQRIYDIQVQSGNNLQNLSLPIDPDGVVYNSLTRAPLAGVTLRLVDINSNSALPPSCFVDPNQQGQVTRSDGYYKFDINFFDPSCPSGGSYAIDMTPPGPGYETGISRVISPPDPSAPPFNVPSCPAGPTDAIPTTGEFCEQQASEFAPAPSVPARSAGTAYHLRLVLNDSRLPGSSQLYNNHLPVDPTLSGLVTITKITPMVNVTRGQMIPYTLTFKNTWDFPLTDVNVVDRYPVGFKYVEGSARFDDQPLEPTVADGQLVWANLTLAAKTEYTIKLLLAPGAGVTEGKFTNYAHVQHNSSGQALSGQASATIRIVPDPTFDCTDVTGKVFDDHNRNGIQDDGEDGIAGARLVSPIGLAALTDPYGRFHITCAITPREGRGSNFMLKLDDRSLPTGYRGSTDAFKIARATRGKALHFSFGASIHKVIGLDIADAVFAPNSTEMRPQWRPRVNLLLEELQKGPAVLRLSYLADVEDRKLVEQRVEAMTQLVSSAWGELHCCYKLVVEHEVFWRTGGPPSEDSRLSALREANP